MQDTSIVASQDKLIEIEQRWIPEYLDNTSSYADRFKRRSKQIRLMGTDVEWLVSEVKRLRNELEKRPMSYWEPSPEWFQYIKTGGPITYGEDY